ncbi:MAG: GNAT family N-acetyltransferase [Clostridia bacterium]|nr:GNAT family N-acetyltransferase [Clostridia bacterium]
MVEIVEVSTKKQLKDFVDYPNRLYSENKYFVPATFGDDFEDWNREKNPAFAYCDAKCWLAMRDGKIVGRIGAIISHRANEKWNTRRMRFTQVDFIDDREVSTALFEAVENWAKEMKCEEVHGPLGFMDFDREGLLVQGFDRRSLFFTYYNDPYYAEHLEALGYEKDVDWIENLINIPRENELTKYLKDMSDKVMKKYNLHLADARRQRDFAPLIPAFFRLVNICYAGLYSTVDLSDEQIDRYAKKFAPLINPNLSAFVMDENGEMVGMAVGAPSLADAMQKSRGKYFPFGWARMLKALYINDTIDLLLIAVHPNYQRKGVNAILMNKLIEGCNRMGITKAETGPTLELNKKVLSQWRYMDKEQHKRRRCFVKKI